MARPYEREWGMRDDGRWGERSDRDERGGRSGEERDRFAEERGRYEERSAQGRARDAGERRYGVSDWDRARFREAPEYRREESYGWSNEPGDFSQSRARNYHEWDWRNLGDDRSRYGRDYGERGYRSEFEPRENRWEQRPQHTTWPGIGAPGEGHAAFEGAGGQRTHRGGHAGKGPRGYTRSDERIREDVCDRLSLDDELDASDIAVTVSKGEVTLEGSVPDRHSKRRAEDISDSVLGVNEVHNRLRSNKGLMEEVGDKLMGRNTETAGHAGSGTRNAPTGTVGTPQQNSH